MKDEAKTKKQLIEDLAALRDRCTEEAIEHYYDTGTAVNALLRLSLEDYSLEELLQKALDIILSVSSLSIETKGCIFLVEDEPEVLIQKVQKGLAEPLLKECARVPFGKCLCGRAASIKRIAFADHIDERHEINYEGIASHGHYCVPILLSGNTIGVINLYLKDGHSRVGREEEFLDSVANTLAGIIKRKRAEEVLRESEERYRVLFEGSTHGILMTDIGTGRFVDANLSICRMLGYSKTELLQLGIEDIHPKDLRDHVMSEIESQVRGGQPVSRAIPCLRKDGTVFHADIIGANTSFHGRRCAVGFFMDITDRKRAEEELKQSEERYRSIFENAQEGIFRSTPDGKVIMANPAMAKMFGYESLEEMITGVTDVARQHYVNSDDRRKLKEIIEEHGFIKGYEVQNYRKDGSIIWISLTMQAVRDAEGRVLYYEGLNEDITIKKESIERIRKALGATIQAIAVTVETRDPYTAGHQRRVADLARSIATEMNLSTDQIDGIRMAAIIHDLGKISVPAEILSKPTKLTNIEFSLIKTHAQAGYDILKDINFPWPIARMILEHHERMDGSGYPHGLTGDSLLLESRILSIADVVEAMASHRPYRPGLGLDAALEEIEKNRGTLYDDAVTDACLRLFREIGYQLQ